MPCKLRCRTSRPVSSIKSYLLEGQPCKQPEWAPNLHEFSRNIRAAALRAEKKKERKYIDDTDEEGEAQRIMGMDRTLLQTCFVCGKRYPQEDGRSEVLWVSCSNSAVCKAWAHILCCSGVGDQCIICRDGHCQFEEVET